MATTQAERLEEALLNEPAKLSSPSEASALEDTVVAGKATSEPTAVPLFHPTPTDLSSKAEAQRALTPGPVEPTTPPSDPIPDTTVTLLSAEDPALTPSLLRPSSPAPLNLSAAASPALSSRSIVDTPPQTADLEGNAFSLGEKGFPSSSNPLGISIPDAGFPREEASPVEPEEKDVIPTESAVEPAPVLSQAQLKDDEPALDIPTTAAFVPEVAEKSEDLVEEQPAKTQEVTSSDPLPTSLEREPKKPTEDEVVPSISIDNIAEKAPSEKAEVEQSEEEATLPTLTEAKAPTTHEEESLEVPESTEPLAAITSLPEKEEEAPKPTETNKEEQEAISTSIPDSKDEEPAVLPTAVESQPSKLDDADIRETQEEQPETVVPLIVESKAEDPEVIPPAISEEAEEPQVSATKVEPVAIPSENNLEGSAAPVEETPVPANIEESVPLPNETVISESKPTPELAHSGENNEIEDTSIQAKESLVDSDTAFKPTENKSTPAVETEPEVIPAAEIEHETVSAVKAEPQVDSQAPLKSSDDETRESEHLIESPVVTEVPETSPAVFDEAAKELPVDEPEAAPVNAQVEEPSANPNFFQAPEAEPTEVDTEQPTSHGTTAAIVNDPHYFGAETPGPKDEPKIEEPVQERALVDDDSKDEDLVATELPSATAEPVTTENASLETQRVENAVDNEPESVELAQPAAEESPAKEPVAEGPITEEPIAPTAITKSEVPEVDEAETVEPVESIKAAEATPKLEVHEPEALEESKPSELVSDSTTTVHPVGESQSPKEEQSIPTTDAVEATTSEENDEPALSTLTQDDVKDKTTIDLDGAPFTGTLAAEETQVTDEAVREEAAEAKDETPETPTGDSETPVTEETVRSNFDDSTPSEQVVSNIPEESQKSVTEQEPVADESTSIPTAQEVPDIKDELIATEPERSEATEQQEVPTDRVAELADGKLQELEVTPAAPVAEVEPIEPEVIQESQTIKPEESSVSIPEPKEEIELLGEDSTLVSKDDAKAEEPEKVSEPVQESEAPIEPVREVEGAGKATKLDDAVSAPITEIAEDPLVPASNAEALVDGDQEPQADFKENSQPVPVETPIAEQSTDSNDAAPLGKADEPVVPSTSVVDYTDVTELKDSQEKSTPAVVASLETEKDDANDTIAETPSVLESEEAAPTTVHVEEAAPEALPSTKTLDTDALDTQEASIAEEIQAVPVTAENDQVKPDHEDLNEPSNEIKEAEPSTLEAPVAVESSVVEQENALADEKEQGDKETPQEVEEQLVSAPKDIEVSPTGEDDITPTEAHAQEEVGEVIKEDEPVAVPVAEPSVDVNEAKPLLQADESLAEPSKDVLETPEAAVKTQEAVTDTKDEVVLPADDVVEREVTQPEADLAAQTPVEEQPSLESNEDVIVAAPSSLADITYAQEDVDTKDETLVAPPETTEPEKATLDDSQDVTIPEAREEEIETVSAPVEETQKHEPVTLTDTTETTVESEAPAVPVDEALDAAPSKVDALDEKPEETLEATLVDEPAPEIPEAAHGNEEEAQEPLAAVAEANNKPEETEKDTPVDTLESQAPVAETTTETPVLEEPLEEAPPIPESSISEVKNEHIEEAEVKSIEATEDITHGETEKPSTHHESPADVPDLIQKEDPEGSLSAPEVDTAEKALEVAEPELEATATEIAAEPVDSPVAATKDEDTILPEPEKEVEEPIATIAEAETVKTDEPTSVTREVDSTTPAVEEEESIAPAAVAGVAAVAAGAALIASDQDDESTKATVEEPIAENLKDPVPLETPAVVGTPADIEPSSVEKETEPEASLTAVEQIDSTVKNPETAPEDPAPELAAPVETASEITQVESAKGVDDEPTAEPEADALQLTDNKLEEPLTDIKDSSSIPESIPVDSEVEKSEPLAEPVLGSDDTVLDSTPVVAPVALVESEADVKDITTTEALPEEKSDEVLKAEEVRDEDPVQSAVLENQTDAPEDIDIRDELSTTTRELPEEAHENKLVEQDEPQITATEDIAPVTLDNEEDKVVEAPSALPESVLPETTDKLDDGPKDVVEETPVATATEPTEESIITTAVKDEEPATIEPIAKPDLVAEIEEAPKEIVEEPVIEEPSVAAEALTSEEPPKKISEAVEEASVPTETTIAEDPIESVNEAVNQPTSEIPTSTEITSAGTLDKTDDAAEEPLQETPVLAENTTIDEPIDNISEPIISEPVEEIVQETPLVKEVPAIDDATTKTEIDDETAGEPSSIPESLPAEAVSKTIPAAVETPLEHPIETENVASNEPVTTVQPVEELVAEPTPVSEVTASDATPEVSGDAEVEKETDHDLAAAAVGGAAILGASAIAAGIATADDDVEEAREAKEPIAPSQDTVEVPEQTTEETPIPVKEETNEVENTIVPAPETNIHESSAPETAAVDDKQEFEQVPVTADLDIPVVTTSNAVVEEEAAPKEEVAQKEEAPVEPEQLEFTSVPTLIGNVSVDTANIQEPEGEIPRVSDILEAQALEETKPTEAHVADIVEPEAIETKLEAPEPIPVPQDTISAKDVTEDAPAIGEAEVPAPRAIEPDAEIASEAPVTETKDEDSNLLPALTAGTAVAGAAAYGVHELAKDEPEEPKQEIQEEIISTQETPKEIAPVVSEPAEEVEKPFVIPNDAPLGGAIEVNEEGQVLPDEAGTSPYSKSPVIEGEIISAPIETDLNKSDAPVSAEPHSTEAEPEPTPVVETIVSAQPGHVEPENLFALPPAGSGEGLVFSDDLARELEATEALQAEEQKEAEIPASVPQALETKEEEKEEVKEQEREEVKEQGKEDVVEHREGLQEAESSTSTGDILTGAAIGTGVLGAGALGYAAYSNQKEDKSEKEIPAPLAANQEVKPLTEQPAAEIKPAEVKAEAPAPVTPTTSKAEIIETPRQSVEVPGSPRADHVKDLLTRLSSRPSSPVGEEGNRPNYFASFSSNTVVTSREVETPPAAPESTSPYLDNDKRKSVPVLSVYDIPGGPSTIISENTPANAAKTEDPKQEQEAVVSSSQKERGVVGEPEINGGSSTAPVTGQPSTGNKDNTAVIGGGVSNVNLTAGADDGRPTTSRAPTITNQARHRRVVQAFLHIFFFSWFGGAGRIFTGLFSKKNKTAVAVPAQSGQRNDAGEGSSSGETAVAPK